MSCRFAGCRLILLLVFALLVCGTCAFTDWLRLAF
jgi:hypothetical protein